MAITSRRSLTQKGKNWKHSDKWRRCVQHVKDRNDEKGQDYNPYAVCTASIGVEETFEPVSKAERPMALVCKSEEEQQIVYGEVYAPDRPDAQGEYMTRDEIRKMAHEFIRSGKMSSIDVLHDNKVVKGCCVVESFVAEEADPRFIPGSWVVGVHIPDEGLWQRVKKGEINGFSMEALVSRHEQEVDVEIPPVVTGMTSKSEDHEHKYFVTYDEEGNFKGGVTDTVLNHFHVIKAGTHTEDAENHRHRFSSVDNVRILV